MNQTRRSPLICLCITLSLCACGGKQAADGDMDTAPREEVMPPSVGHTFTASTFKAAKCQSGEMRILCGFAYMKSGLDGQDLKSAARWTYGGNNEDALRIYAEINRLLAD